jgi:uncharacterized HhH-GPD family protein
MVYLASTDEANALLEQNPFALLVGMQLDQQIPMEKAFTGPAVLQERMGKPFSASAVAELDPEVLTELCSRPPAVHRFPRAAAGRLHTLADRIVTDFDGDAASLWRTSSSGDELVRRLGSLPGFGPQKARIFTALLAKQFAVKPRGWTTAAGDYAAKGYRSVADVVDQASLEKVRAHKKSVKAAAKAAQMGS